MARHSHSLGNAAASRPSDCQVTLRFLLVFRLRYTKSREASVGGLIWEERKENPRSFRMDVTRLRKCKGGLMYQETNVGEPVSGRPHSMAVLHGTGRRQKRIRCIGGDAEAKTSHLMLVLQCRLLWSEWNATQWSAVA
jgi:hypothetical protein